MVDSTPTNPLGKKIENVSQYTPDLLYPIPREINRNKIGITEPLPFYGCDSWVAYELSWLNNRGKPQVAIAEIIVPCDTPNLIESKSLKLYFNSFSNTPFDHQDKVQAIITHDLQEAASGLVSVQLRTLAEYQKIPIDTFDGLCLDNLDVVCEQYQCNPTTLRTKTDKVIEETVYSDLLKANCPVTNGPDWGSIQIRYRGFGIDHAGLLQYIVSYRDHNEFHELSVERMFMDIMQRCHPEKLTVLARYTRRGGIDINPLRSTEADYRAMSQRLVRQ